MGGVPRELRRAAAPLLPPLRPRAAPAKVLPPLRRTYYSTPLHHAAVLSSLCSPSSLRSAFRIGRACVPAVPSASHCPSACTAALARGFSRSGHLARLLSSLRPARPLEFPSFLFHHKKKAKIKRNLGAMVETIHFAFPPPELSVIMGSPGAAVAFG